MATILRSLTLSLTEPSSSPRVNREQTRMTTQVSNLKTRNSKFVNNGGLSFARATKAKLFNRRRVVYGNVRIVAHSGYYEDFHPGHRKVKVLGLGQAMVDFAASIQPEFLDSLSETTIPDLEVGGRCCIGATERGEVLTAMDGCDYKLSAGGSLSNTLVALSRLGEYTQERSDKFSFEVSIACSLGPDYLGEFYRTKLRKAGVEVLSDPGEDGTTGSVIVLTTPDAHRTMLSCWGTSATLKYDSALDRAVANTDLLVIEGYLWEMPETIASIRSAIRTARKYGVKVAFTASDASCVSKHKEEFWELLQNGDVDIFFANKAEALEMCDNPEQSTKEQAIKNIGNHAGMVIVTDGHHGASLMRNGIKIQVPPYWTAEKPVDTCGAGDAYAAGCLYGMLTEKDVRAVGEIGARVSSVVISHNGARLSEEDAKFLTSEPLFQHDSDEAQEVAQAGGVDLQSIPFYRHL